MKAAVLYANRDLRYTDWPEPACGPGDIKVQVSASGVCGSDVPRVLHGGAHFYPIVLGHEFAGIVAEAGEGVEHLKPGDKVAGVPLVPCLACADCQRGDYALCGHYSFIGSRRQGSFADFVVIPARNAVRVDSAVPDHHVALFEPATVALHGLFLNDFRGGQTCLVLGCGTVGIFAIQWARILGAGQVIAVDLSDSRLALAGRMGADVLVNSREAGWEQAVRDHAGPDGPQEVYETAGSPVTMAAAFRLAGKRARLCFIGTPQENLTFTPKDFEQMNRKEFRLTGSWMSYSAPFPGREWEWTARYAATGQLRFDPALYAVTLPLSKAAEAFNLFLRPERPQGKVILRPDGETA